MWSRIALRKARKGAANGESHLADGELEAASRQFGKALSLVSDAVATDPEAAAVAAGAHIGIGRIWLARSDPVKAMPEFGAAQRLSPNGWESYYWTGCGAAHLADYRMAHWNLTVALQRNPSLGKAYVQRGYVSLRLGKVEETVADFHVAARMAAMDDNALLVLAALRLQRREWGLAVAALRAVQDGQQAPMADGMLGFALEQQGDDPAALLAYVRAIEGGNKDDAVLFHHGLISYRLGLLHDSMRSWSELHRRHAQRGQYAPLLARAAHALAHKAIGRRDYRAAIRYLEEVAGSRPSRALDDVIVDLHLHLAAGTASHQEAREHLLAARDRRHDDYRVLHRLAWLDFLAGDLAQAARQWSQVLDARPEDRQVRYALAICAGRQGDHDTARRQLAELAGEHDWAGQQATHALAALAIRDGQWSAAAELLEPLDDSDPWREAVLPECRYRSGEGTDAGPWQAAVHAAKGRAPELVADNARLRREVGLLLQSAALTEAEAARWEPALTLLEAATNFVELPESDALFQATVRIMGGRREQGIRILTAASRSAPADHRLTHALALAQLHTLAAGESGLTWRACIATWGALLHDEEFWDSWCARAAQRYGVPVEKSVVEPLRNALRDFLNDRFPTENVGRYPPGLLLQRELDAASALGSLGGFRYSDDAPPLVCGPMRIADLGLQREFGSDITDAVAVLEYEHDVEPDDKIAGTLAKGRHLMRCFSQLGIADCHLTADRPKEALAVLDDLRCNRCVKRAKPPLCVENCARFEAYNPAFAGVAGGREMLSMGATELAVEALLRLGQSAVTAPEPDVAAAKTSWRDAIRRAKKLNTHKETERRVVETALGRAEALQRKIDMDGTVDVLKAAQVVTTGKEREQVEAKLSNALATRGIRTANADAAQTEVALTDLRLALKLNRHSLRARSSLGILLRNRALQRLDRADVLKAMDLLRESVDVLNEGLRLTPGQRELTEHRNRASEDLDAIMAAIVSGRRRL